MTVVLSLKKVSVASIPKGMVKDKVVAQNLGAFVYHEDQESDSASINLEELSHLAASYFNTTMVCRFWPSLRNVYAE